MKFCLPLLISFFVVSCASNKTCCCSLTATGHAAAAQPAIAEGSYAGSWTSSDGAGGPFVLLLKKPAADSPWEAKLSFTYNGDEAVTTMHTVEITSTNLHVVYDYQLGDSKGTADMTGEAQGKELAGAYKITTGDGGQGTWKASRVP
jgi:hypothetical protein